MARTPEQALITQKNTAGFEHDITPMVTWRRWPAPIAPNIGTVGVDAAQALQEARAEGRPVWGLGGSAYPITGATPKRVFDGNFGVYNSGPDRRVLRPRTDIPMRGTRIR